MKITLLSRKLAEVAPIDGVSESGVIWFQDAATDEQRAAAQEILDNWVDPPDPNWLGFRTGLYANAAWIRVLRSNTTVGATIASGLWQVEVNPSLATEIKFLWDNLIVELDPPLDTAEIDSLNHVASANHVPVSVDPDGFLSFSG